MQILRFPPPPSPLRMTVGGIADRIFETHVLDRMIVPTQQAMWNKDGVRRSFAVYIMSNRSMTLYTGMSNDLKRRVRQHKAGSDTKSFTSRYHVKQLVYFETFDYATQAIAREKELKGWTRARKIALVKSVNPEWRDLAEDW